MHISTIESSRFVSHRARMLGGLDSRKDPQSTKFKQRPQTFVKLSFRELCNSKLSGLHPFDNMAIIHRAKIGQNTLQVHETPILEVIFMMLTEN